MRDSDQIFRDSDLKMRSILQDAQEEVPAGVWKAVRSRISPKAPILLLRRYYRAAAALACMVCVALILRVSFHNESAPDAHSAAKSISSAVSRDAGTESLVALAAPEYKNEGTTAGWENAPSEAASGQKAIKPAAAPEGNATPAALPAQEGDATAESSAQGSPATAESSAQGDTAQSASSAAEDGESVRETWRRILEEDRDTRPHFRKTIALSGSLGGNESDQKAVHGWMGTDDGESESIREIGISRFGVPFTLGVSAKLYLADKFALGTGLSYSLLTRTFNGIYKGTEGDVSHNIHYLGIPLNAYYDVMELPSLLLYFYAGGQADWCLASKYTLWSSPDKISVSEKVTPIQWSTTLGFGVEFKLSDRLGLYLDPGVRYFFHSEGQPKSSRTTEPLQINIEAGLRFDLR